MEVGQQVWLSVKAGKPHVFDPKSGENWVRPPRDVRGNLNDVRGNGRDAESS